MKTNKIRKEESAMTDTTYATRAEAEASMEYVGLVRVGRNLYTHPGVWYLRHGEYSAPEYKARKVAGGWAIYRKVYFYRGTINAPKSGYVDLIGGEP